MPKASPTYWLLLPVLFAGFSSAAQTSSGFFPGVTVTPDAAPFVGVTSAPAAVPFAGVAPAPLSSHPLTAQPAVLALDHLPPAQMSDADNEIVSNLSPELSRQAALANFDISSPEWHYDQMQCPAFPGFVFLSFHHGPDAEGSSHFVAVLPRSSSEVRVVSTYAHGLLPFESSWDRPGSFEVFNRMLREERGTEPLSDASNWLMIGVCYAEFSGYPVQVVTAAPRPEPTLDLLRLNGNPPQLRIHADGSAEITFSDVSRPGFTSHWKLNFDRRGQITHAGKDQSQQLPAIALKP